MTDSACMLIDAVNAINAGRNVACAKLALAGNGFDGVAAMTCIQATIAYKPQQSEDVRIRGARARW